MMTLRDLNKFNTNGLNNHQLSMIGGVSYPTVAKYMDGDVKEASLYQVAKLLVAMGCDLAEVRLSDVLAIGEAE